MGSHMVGLCRRPARRGPAIWPRWVAMAISKLSAIRRKRGILEFANGYLEVFDFVELERIGSPRELDVEANLAGKKRARDLWKPSSLVRNSLKR